MAAVEGKEKGEAELEAAEIKRWSFTLAVTRRESVRNEDIRGAGQCWMFLESGGGGGRGEQREAGLRRFGRVQKKGPDTPVEGCNRQARGLEEREERRFVRGVEDDWTA